MDLNDVLTVVENGINTAHKRVEQNDHLGCELEKNDSGWYCLDHGQYVDFDNSYLEN